MNHAAQLLTDGELKVAAVAASAGFSGAAHLHRAFRR
jgi:transcriptional regulator GlxA family with amidase domain